jgi:hypothetical protein
MYDQVLFEKATQQLQLITELLLENNTGAESFVISATGGGSYSVTRDVMIAFVGGKDPGRLDIGESDASA